MPRPIVWKRSWFSDPAGWADDYLGSARGYWSFAAACLLLLVFSLGNLRALTARHSISFGESWHLYLAPVLLFALACIFLRAARAASRRSAA